MSFAVVSLKNERASYYTSKMSLFRDSKGIVIQDKQTVGNHRQIWRDEGEFSFYYTLEEIEEVCFTQKFTGEEEEFEVVAGSHWLGTVISALFLGRKGSLSSSWKEKMKLLCERPPWSKNFHLPSFCWLQLCVPESSPFRAFQIRLKWGLLYLHTV